MTTSLAALAATSSAHTSSSNLISTTNTSNNSNQSNSTQANQNQALFDTNDTNYDIKTEFYTREGLWKLIKNCEYARQQQNSQLSTQSINSPNLNQSNNLNNSTNSTNSNQNQNVNQNYLTNIGSNDPVKIGLFKYSKHIVFKDLISNEKKNLKHKFYLCNTCKAKLNQKHKFGLKRLNESSDDELVDDEDDDNDVIFTPINNNSDDDEYRQEYLYNDDDDDDDDDEIYCKFCNMNLADGDTDTSDEDELNNDTTKAKNIQNTLDLIMFNFSREIYTYEFNSVKSKNDMKNLMDKKSYKTVLSTCFDINKPASISNTACLQLSKSNSSNNIDYNSLSFNLSPSNLSLIVAAGFNKGEIHVFDAFKKDASVFYNNSKLVDKSKVTCIKWLPNSMNLFLVGYSSGSMYLYDAQNQTQAQVAPVYTKLCQNESFSVYINSNSTQSTSEDLNNPSSSSLNKSSNQSLQQHQPYKKLVISNSNQQSQVAKNPLLKLTIGPESSYNYGVNSVNDFEFSPCGNYLAIVNQDGYLRVFSFYYKNNQQMQLELKCSMKSYFGGLLCVTWSSDGKYIATGGEDDLITVFSFVEMRVACRGRGHSSWINSCAFDPWTKLSNYLNANFLNSTSHDSDKEKENNDDSDLEELHNKKNLSENELEKLDSKSKSKITAPKKRTISTLSDYNCNNNCSNSTTIYYRLASVGQDNQICFWDLTEDVLKEKSNHNSRSRITSMIVNQQQSQFQHNVPQILVQETTETPVKDSKSHSTASSILLTAKSLLSSKNSSSGDKIFQQNINENEESINNNNNNNNQNNYSNKSNTLTGSFFKRHKRNSSLNNNHLNETNKSKLNNKNNNNNNSPIVLNSYKKSANIFSTLPNDLINESNINSGISSLNINSPNNKKLITSPQLNKKQQNIQQQQCQPNPFNLCPKLDEVPLIEPLICKRISNERLTSIVFKKDCFNVANQDGFVFTWSRPKKNDSYRANISAKLLNEGKINSTSL